MVLELEYITQEHPNSRLGRTRFSRFTRSELHTVADSLLNGQIDRFSISPESDERVFIWEFEYRVNRGAFIRIYYRDGTISAIPTDIHIAVDAICDQLGI